jgi:hypothetical protein
MPLKSATSATASSAAKCKTTESPCSAHGIRGKTVTDISPRLLTQHEGLRGLVRLDAAELAQ